MKQYQVVFFGLAVGVLGLVRSSDALAGPNDHEDGFFLRLSIGGGAASTKQEDGTDRLKFSGPAGDINIAIGAVVSPNLAVHGTLFGWAMSEPDVELNGSEGELDGDLAMSAFGGGITYYVMPSNLYLSGSVGIASMTLDAGEVELESDNGLAVDLTVGKEWWVGNNWGLGLAGSVGFHSIPDSGTDEKLTGASVALRFSATMN